MGLSREVLETLFYSVCHYRTNNPDFSLVPYPCHKYCNQEAAGSPRPTFFSKFLLYGYEEYPFKLFK